MKKDIKDLFMIDDEEVKNKVGRPKLADSDTKKKTLLFALFSFILVILLLVFGYGTLFGGNIFDKITGNINKSNNDTKNEFVMVNEINPIIKKITLKENTARKLYLTVLPANASDKSIEYESSDPSIAVVDETGKVVGIKKGKTTVTATTKDGSNISTEFNINVIKNVESSCRFDSLSKTSDGIEYSIKCKNAKIKEIQYKVDKDYEKLLTKKQVDTVKFNSEDLKKKITFKVVYYPNNSGITKYSTKTINNTTTTKAKTGNCNLIIKEVKKNSARYDISCNNATVTKIAYKIGDGSYIGIDTSNLADTVLFEESDVTRILYFNINYKIDGTNKVKTITKSNIIEKMTNKSEDVLDEEGN